MMNNLEIDGGKTPLFAPVKTNVKNDGGKTPLFAPVKTNVKNDGGKRAVSAHVNPTTGGQKKGRICTRGLQRSGAAIEL